jgi:hypothetical protein
LQATNTPFLRYHRLDTAALQRLYAREAAELLTLAALEGEDVFVQACMDKLRVQWLSVCPTLSATTTLDQLCAMPTPLDKTAEADEAAKPRLNVAAATFIPQALGGGSALPFPSADVRLPATMAVHPGDNPGTYFYQAADGHHVFLANISRKMLEMVSLVQGG